MDINNKVVGLDVFSLGAPEQIDDSISAIPKRSYEWLDGDPNKVEWKFVENLTGQYECRLKLTWKSTFETMNLSSIGRWKGWVSYIKEFAIMLIEGSTSLNAPGSQKAKAQNLKYVAQFMCFSRHRSSAKEITKSDVKALEIHLKEREVSVSYVSEVLRTLRQLWSEAFDNIESITFDPYVGTSEISRKAKEIGVKNGHTRTLKPDEGLSILNSALSLIENSKDTLDNYDLYRKLKTTHTCPYKAFRLRAKQRATEFLEEVRMLYGAAIVVCFTLTAMRKHELSEITEQFAQDLVTGETDILTGKVRKTAHVSEGKVTERSTVPELVKAIEVVLRLTSDVRETSKSKTLFLKLSTHNSVRGGHVALVELGLRPLYSLLDLLAKHANYEKDTLRPHMFRRFFSMMWSWRFELGDLHYLARMLFHNGFEFTRAYTDDDDVWDFLPQDIKDLTHTIFEDMLLHGRKMAGGFSRTIERYRRLIQANVHIVSPEQVSALIDKLIEKNDYTIIPAADGYCFMSKHRAKNAKCTINGVMPDYANRNEIRCGGCSNFGVSERKLAIWQRRKDAHQKTYNTTNSSELKRQAKKGMALAERMLNAIAIREA